MKRYVIIVAGGSGSRMNTDLPKQFLKIDGIPVIIRTIMKFEDLVDNIVVVIPESYISLWEELKIHYFPALTIKSAIGGETRTHSVINGLSEIKSNEGLVAIHDAARPFVSKESIKKTFEKASETGSGVLAVPLKDSLRKVEKGYSENRDRASYYLMQTPQTFSLRLLKKAYSEAIDVYTDDASAFEAAGNSVTLVDGTYQNIKITTPEDIFIGEAILKFQEQS